MFKYLNKSYLSKVRIGNGDFVEVEGKGSIQVETLSSTKILNNVLYVPKLSQNLVSVGQLLESDYSLLFNRGVCEIKVKHGVLLLSTKMVNRSFCIDWKNLCLSANTCEESNSVLWHKRMGHVKYAGTKKDG